MKRLLLIAALIVAVPTSAQVNNLANFDRELMHYGIQVGYTQSKFDIGYTDDESVREVLQGVNSYYSAGFHIAVIADMALCPYVSLRSAPGLTLINRNVTYYWEEGYLTAHPGSDHKRSVESVYGEVPFDLKFRAMRWNNFQPYLTGGCSYGFDFASLRNNKNNNDESIVRLNTSDFRYTMGIGFDFFLRYVKFAIELKMTFGLSDLVIPDDDLYSRSTQTLNSRTFMLGFTFEG